MNMNIFPRLFTVMFVAGLAGMGYANPAAQGRPSSEDIEVVVHRGANFLAPENTLPSARAALKYGAEWIELDVRKSKDGVLYNLHDETLDRTTDGHGPIHLVTSSEIERLDAGSWFGPAFRGLKVPRIETMLDSLKGKANVFFDVKKGTPVADLVKLVRAKGFEKNSFFWFADAKMVPEFVKLAPEMKIKVNASDIEGIKKWQAVCRPSYVEIEPENITKNLVNYCHKNGILVMAAIQNGNEEAYKKAIQAQPDLVNIDQPELWARVVAESEGEYVAPLSQYVDPRIGSEGLGRVFIGPSCPYGMVKPSPDCTPSPNSGWLPMPERVDGFAQVHVSGTGGGPKYGNVLVTPFGDGMDRVNHYDYREYETIRLGYYDTQFKQNGIRTEITTANRASFYRFTYPEDSLKSLAVDAGFFLGENPVPDAREAQQFVGSEIQVLSDHEVAGYTRIRGGWNNGKAYTVYFYAETDRPFVQSLTWKGNRITEAQSQYDSAEKTGALLRFAKNDKVVQLKVGISFLSMQKAKINAHSEIPHWSFEKVHQDLLGQWEQLLQKIEINPSTPLAKKRMFYTGLYHTMLMPVDRTGENPLWSDPEPYYDDFYAIWDTYRSSSPLITLIDPKRETDIVRSLVNIYKRDGYMPDARSGNSNGRTQGGSNAEIVIADAFVKGLKGIDYELALEAMLKDATVPPGGNEEAEGRGGLIPYLELGYIPHGIDRAGNRTVEYSYCDYAIALVAKGLGKEDLYQRYLKQSENWKNLWRGDYEHEGAKGFIMPRDKEGNWLDSIPFGHSTRMQPKFKYTPVTFEGPWYTPWWSMFFYEASSWEYSLSIPHDVPGLIEKCGGAADFEKRLDIFFDKGFFNVNNEPSFLTPCLYHWLGKPWRSSDRIREIIAKNYNDGPVGLPGNDDSGAMSSWLAFHMIGLYPNAGQDYYLIHTPLLTSTTFHLEGGKEFKVVAEGLSDKNCYIQGVTLNGKDYPYSVLRHKDIMAGGELVLKMGKKPGNWGKELGLDK
ncbi:GH92 family glycosyl hydrolase [Phocaeicola plebeius]|uniref:GH92 family glycosyl hydrolase n=1 Tax=Phocaeicola plebeius TaxID=310297 RepID=UPI00307ED43D